MLPRGALHFPCKSVSFWTYGGMDRDIYRLDRQGGHFLDAVREREVASVCTFIVISINALPFLVFSPIYHWNRVVLFAGFSFAHFVTANTKEKKTVCFFDMLFVQYLIFWTKILSISCIIIKFELKYYL